MEKRMVRKKKKEWSKETGCMRSERKGKRVKRMGGIEKRGMEGVRKRVGKEGKRGVLGERRGIGGRGKNGVGMREEKERVEKDEVGKGKEKREGKEKSREEGEKGKGKRKGRGWKNERKKREKGECEGEA